MKKHLHYCKKATWELCNINITQHNMDRHVRVVHPESEAGKKLKALKDKRRKGERVCRNGGKRRNQVEDKSTEQDVGRSSQREKKGGKSIAPAPLNGQKCKLCDHCAIKDAMMTAHIMKVHVNARKK